IGMIFLLWFGYGGGIIAQGQRAVLVNTLNSSVSVAADLDNGRVQQIGRIRSKQRVAVNFATRNVRLTFVDNGGPNVDPGFISLAKVSVIKLEGRFDRKGRRIAIIAKGFAGNGAKVFQAVGRKR